MPHIGIISEEPRNATILAQLRAMCVVDPNELLRVRQALDRLRRRTGKPWPSLDRALARPSGQADPLPPLSQDAKGADIYRLGTHPDIVERLWAIGRSLPQDCSWICYGRPVLAHAQSGVIFGLGIGTLGYGLRAPEIAGDVSLIRGKTYRGLAGPKTFSWQAYGPDWAFGTWSARDFEIAQSAWQEFA